MRTIIIYFLKSKFTSHLVGRQFLIVSKIAESKLKVAIKHRFNFVQVSQFTVTNNQNNSNQFLSETRLFLFNNFI